MVLGISKIKHMVTLSFLHVMLEIILSKGNTKNLNPCMPIKQNIGSTPSPSPSVSERKALAFKASGKRLAVHYSPQDAIRRTQQNENALKT